MDLKNKLNTRVIRYLLAGGASYAVELGSILAFIHLLRLSDVMAVAISFWIGLLASFGLQKIFVFSSNTTSKKTIGQLLLYLILVAINYGFTLGFVALLYPTLDVTISRTIALVITTAWNFVLYSKIIFRHEKNTGHPQ